MLRVSVRVWSLAFVKWLERFLPFGPGCELSLERFLLFGPGCQL